MGRSARRGAEDAPDLYAQRPDGRAFCRKLVVAERVERDGKEILAAKIA